MLNHASKLRVALSVSGAALFFVEPALAGASSVPGPIIGAGLPLLAVAGAAYGVYWVVGKLRNRD